MPQVEARHVMNKFSDKIMAHAVAYSKHRASCGERLSCSNNVCVYVCAWVCVCVSVFCSDSPRAELDKILCAIDRRVAGLGGFSPSGGFPPSEM